MVTKAPLTLVHLSSGSNHILFISPSCYIEMIQRCQTLSEYKDLVFNTADFMASFVKFRDGKYHLCHPLIPAQEIFKATETDDPAYELQYWYYGLATAQKWRERLGMPVNEKWNDVIDNLDIPCHQGRTLSAGCNLSKCISR